MSLQTDSISKSHVLTQKKCICKSHEGPAILPATSFYNRLDSADGLQSWCKDCLNRRKATNRGKKKITRKLWNITTAPSEPGMKFCPGPTHNGAAVPITRFAYRSRKPDGRRDICRRCGTENVRLEKLSKEREQVVDAYIARGWDADIHGGAVTFSKSITSPINTARICRTCLLHEGEGSPARTFTPRSDGSFYVRCDQDRVVFKQLILELREGRIAYGALKDSNMNQAELEEESAFVPELTVPYQQPVKRNWLKGLFGARA